MDTELVALQEALTGEYSIEREIGRGGMGIVYLAREVQLDRLVAIKILPAGLAVRSDVRERFLREARTAAGLSHPNIVAIHRVGEAGGVPYFVMTFVDGETLGERLRARGPVAPGLLIRMLRDVAQALGYAHGHGVIHRDVKPDNILIEHGTERALVTDYGIAVARGDSSSAESGGVMGTAQFMSPEQMSGDAIDGRSDLYSLGVVGFLAVTGTLPMDAPDPAALTLKRLSTDAPSVGSVSATVPTGLARVIDQCLARDPSRRPENAERLVSMLEAASAPARAALPLPLRKWAQQPTPFVDMFGIWTVGWSVASAVEWMTLLTNYGRGGTLRWRFLALALAPLAPIAIFQVKKTYRALAAGYTVIDLRHALRAWRTERMEELAFEIGGTRERWWARVLRVVPTSAFVSLLTMGVLSMLARRDYQLQALIELLVEPVLWIGGLSFAALTGLGLSLFPPRLQRRMAGRLRGWLWNGRLGAGLAKLITPRGRTLAAAHFRPTEMVLHLAVGELFAALPATYRDELHDLPDVCERLSARATALREEITRLETVAGAGESASANPAATLLSDARADLTSTVSALERIRLDLTRLHGGLTDLRPLTTSLDAARRVGDDVQRLDAAQRELEGTWRDAPIDQRTPTPA